MLHMRTLSYSKEEKSVQGPQVTWGDMSGQDAICRLSAGTLQTQHPPAQVTGKSQQGNCQGVEQWMTLTAGLAMFLVQTSMVSTFSCYMFIHACSLG